MRPVGRGVCMVTNGCQRPSIGQAGQGAMSLSTEVATSFPDGMGGHVATKPGRGPDMMPSTNTSHLGSIRRARAPRRRLLEDASLQRCLWWLQASEKLGCCRALGVVERTASQPGHTTDHWPRLPCAAPKVPGPQTTAHPRHGSACTAPRLRPAPHGLLRRKISDPPPPCLENCWGSVNKRRR